jgi:hypothetical protein
MSDEQPPTPTPAPDPQLENQTQRDGSGNRVIFLLPIRTPETPLNTRRGLAQ